MDTINSETLFNLYPEFFTHKEDIRNSAMAFGFACKDGWFSLLNNLFRDIHQWFAENQGTVPEEFQVLQVKEKYGSLWVYISAAPMEIHNMIDEAEKRSYYICEVCGKECPKGTKEYVSFYRDKLPYVQTLCWACLTEQLQRYHLPLQDYISDWQKEHRAPFVCK